MVSARLTVGSNALRVQPLKRGGEEQNVHAPLRLILLVSLFTVTHELVDGTGLGAALVEDAPPDPGARLQEGRGTQPLSEGELHGGSPVLLCWNTQDYY